jgi:hypothetical protein
LRPALKQKKDPIYKITKSKKRAVGGAQVVESLPSKPGVQSQILKRLYNYSNKRNTQIFFGSEVHFLKQAVFLTVLYMFRNVYLIFLFLK